MTPTHLLAVLLTLLNVQLNAFVVPIRFAKLSPPNSLNALPAFTTFTLADGLSAVSACINEVCRIIK